METTKYIRIGKFEGCSRNENRGELLSIEAGLSVWYADEQDDGTYINGCDYDVVLESWEYVWEIHQDEPIYLLTGEEVGTGADGEPLLDPKTVEIIAELEYNENDGFFVNDNFSIKELKK